jgi:hypothetical protein
MSYGKPDYTKPVMTMLTPEEHLWLQIERGKRATGCHHSTVRIDDAGRRDRYGTRELHYFWPMGEQMEALARPTVEAAAKAYLAVYERWSGGTAFGNYWPVKRCGCKSGPCWCSTSALQAVA